MPTWLDHAAWNEFLLLTLDAPEQGDIGHPLNSLFGFAGIGRPVPDHFRRARTNRNEVSLYYAADVDDQDRFLAMAAWGSMNRRHARSALESWNHWGAIVEAIRAPKITRAAAYGMFLEAHRNGLMPGIGPAYFTKLIMFVRPDLRGYIMDQWTGKAVEVLSTDGFQLHFSTHGSSHRITPHNTALAYEEFCSRMDQLALVQLGLENLESLTPIQAHDFESRLFSKGGRPPAPWRYYVRNAWRAGPQIR
jgi:hypothetical protein